MFSPKTSRLICNFSEIIRKYENQNDTGDLALHERLLTMSTINKYVSCCATAISARRGKHGDFASII